MNSFSNNFTAVYLPIAKSEKQYQVNHVYCVGRNYTEHAIEMGADERQPPFFFLKPNWAVTSNDVPYPLKTKNLQHEVELVLALGENANIFGLQLGLILLEEIFKQKQRMLVDRGLLGKVLLGVQLHQK